MYNTLRDPNAEKYRIIQNNADMIILPIEKLSCLFLNNKDLFWTIGSFLKNGELLGKLRLCKYAYWINFGIIQDVSPKYRQEKIILRNINIPKFNKFPNFDTLKFIREFVKSNCCEFKIAVHPLIVEYLCESLKQNTYYQNMLCSYTPCGKEDCKERGKKIMQRKLKLILIKTEFNNSYYQ